MQNIEQEFREPWQELAGIEHEENKIEKLNFLPWLRVGEAGETFPPPIVFFKLLREGGGVVEQEFRERWHELAGIEH